VQGLKKSLEEHLALVDRIFLQLKGARDAMVEYLKSFESPIHLAPLSYRYITFYFYSRSCSQLRKPFGSSRHSRSRRPPRSHQVVSFHSTNWWEHSSRVRVASVVFPREGLNHWVCFPCSRKDQPFDCPHSYGSCRFPCESLPLSLFTSTYFSKLNIVSFSFSF
jgi:hypothetical protein